MRRPLATWFSFTLLVGILRVVGYAGSRVGEDLSFAALAHYAALHALAFAFAAVVVAVLGRGTAPHAGQTAFYAQAATILAPFVDLSLDWPLADYEATYALVGGSPGGAVASLLYGAVIAWGVWLAVPAAARDRRLVSTAAGIVGAIGLGLLAAPWPAGLVAGVPPWSLHLYLLAYYFVLLAALIALAIRSASPASWRSIVRLLAPASGAGFAVFPVAGVVGAGRLLASPLPGEPGERLLVEGAYVLGACIVSSALWTQWRCVRARGAGSLRVEAAAIAKSVALAVAVLLGPVAMLLAGVAGSLAWLGRRGTVLPLLGFLAVLVGDVAVPALEFASLSVGPALLTLPLNQTAPPSAAGVALGVLVAAALAAIPRLTSRTSG